VHEVECLVIVPFLTREMGFWRPGAALAQGIQSS
jgi:hypothetical protein